MSKFSKYYKKLQSHTVEPKRPYWRSYWWTVNKAKGDKILRLKCMYFCHAHWYADIITCNDITLCIRVFSRFVFIFANKKRSENCHFSQSTVNMGEEVQYSLLNELLLPTIQQHNYNITFHSVYSYTDATGKKLFTCSWNYNICFVLNDYC